MIIFYDPDKYISDPAASGDNILHRQTASQEINLNVLICSALYRLKILIAA